MKIYQIYSGDTDKHGRPTQTYLATYLNRDEALAHCDEIINRLKAEGEIIEEYPWGGEESTEKGITWIAKGWDDITICFLYEREAK